MIRVVSDDGRSAFLGIGFEERGHAFDFNVALVDFDKHLKQEREAAEIEKEYVVCPSVFFVAAVC